MSTVLENNNGQIKVDNKSTILQVFFIHSESPEITTYSVLLWSWVVSTITGHLERPNLVRRLAFCLIKGRIG